MADERMPWFKWWDGTAADMKFRMVAEDCKLPVACIVGAWAYLLEYASRSADRGSVAGIDLELMGYTLQLPDPETVCNAMKRRKLIDENGDVAKWETRQAKRERSEPSGASTDRVRRFREKQKQNQNSDLGNGDSGNGGNDGNGDETAGNGMEHPKRKRKSREESKPKPSSSAGADGAGEKVKPFDRFWSVYPNRVAKLSAQKAWAKLKLDAKVDEIVAAVEAQKEGQQWRNENGQYIPHPASWLNAGCWLDEVKPYVPAPPKLPAGWWETKDGMAKAGAMLTPPLAPRPGEYPKDFAQRIREALGQVDAVPGSVAQAAPTAPAMYVPPAPPPGVELTQEQRDARREQLREAMTKMNQAAALAKAGVSVE